MYSRELFSNLKKNEVMSFARKWVQKEIIALSECIQTQEDKYHIFFYLWFLDFLQLHKIKTVAIKLHYK